MNQKTTLLPHIKENHMSKKKDTGIFQLDNGNWGFRYAIKINGKLKESKTACGTTISNLSLAKSTLIKLQLRKSMII